VTVGTLVVVAGIVAYEMPVSAMLALLPSSNHMLRQTIP
jgi:hypothetical protein